VVDSAVLPVAHTASSSGNRYDLVLTSEKRRGVYECDYCHSDISQLPRVRCAVCPDFDLCLDCFATTDHTAALARIKAAANTHDALVEEGTATAGSGVSLAALNHDDTHGYRVCDSTRYPLFPMSRKAKAWTEASSSVTEDNLSEAGKPKEDAMQVDVESKKDECEANEVSSTNEGEQNEVTKEVEDQTPEQPKESEEEGTASDSFIFTDYDSKAWTIEEDLRLLEAIRCHGLGNWQEVSETVTGNGSSGKTAKRCMERYLDDYLGKYGRILPPHTLVQEEIDDDESENPGTDETPGSAVRASKRRAVMLRSPGATSITMPSRKRFKAVPTELEGGDKVWQNPYLPSTSTTVGQEVARDQMYKSEQLFVKLMSQMEEDEEVNKLRKEWEETRLLKPGGPTVLPIRPDDVATLPGAEISGFMPRRGDFDIEWDNDAEQAIADMEFIPGEPKQDRELKLKVMAIYNARLDERDKRKQFVLSRKLYDYRAMQTQEQILPSDERDLIHRMRLFERFHTPEEHKVFIADLLKAKRIRKEIAKLQTYRRLGIRTLAEAEVYELDKTRRTFHKGAAQQKDPAEAPKVGDVLPGNALEPTDTDPDVSASLWKQYRTTDRKARKSINRGSPGEEGANTESKEGGTEGGTNPKSETNDANSADAMDVDGVGKNADGKIEDIKGMSGYSLLSTKEADLCRKLELSPKCYQEIKSALIHESLIQGLLDKESPGSSRRSLVKIDVQRRGDVIDFMVSAGWVSTKAGNFGKTLRATDVDPSGETPVEVQVPETTSGQPAE
jgi:hypothetical protein